MKTTLLFFAIFLCGLLLFRESFFIDFFQDDYFLLKISNVDTATEVLQFLIPRIDVQFYRPLSHELWYFLMRKLFGMQPLTWHGAAFILWATMLILVYKIGKKFLRQKTLHYLFPILYGLSDIHYSTVFWSINTSYLMVSVFFFSAFHVWWSDDPYRKKILFLSALFFLGLLANELMMTILPLLIFDASIRQRMSPLGVGRMLFPLLIITGVYTGARIMFPPDIGSYPIEPSAIPSSYRWFGFFFLNWPEGIKDNMLTFWKIRPEFFRYFFPQIVLWSSLTMLVAASTFICFSFSIFRNGITKKYLLSLVFFSSWFFISLLPIVPVPSHITPHHGSISLAGFLLVLLIPIDTLWKRIAPFWRYAGIYAVLILWLISARTTVIFNNDTYWIKRRSDIAVTWKKRIQTLYPHPANGTEIIIPTDEKEVRVALNEGEAIRQWYGNSSLIVKFLPTNTD